ncbi:hypothetical protein BFP72_18775 [Reichenbachiella sp. 5M10]|uniref:hypothetical protein n=1 Tax=Reichenbachiella sp. 5M10 TaxID=1889772 RepID=UPI000C5E0B28|nr:hypothetical protein [Reichenbachiella sp. 5M10]PIB37308.1 hypothetical protein BFP72_18775 [Reichenbachiella sp. 5M10]
MDEWKNHVESKRESFEMYDVPKGTWDQVEGWLDEDNRHIRLPRRYLWRGLVGAAALLLALGLGLTSLLVEKYQATAISPELVEVQNYYQGEIALKMQQVSHLENFADISRDMETLDEAFVQMKRDLNDNVDNQEVINEMIENYKIKLEILERILERLDQSDAKKL